MINFPSSIEGNPLFELIGKEVEVTYANKKKPAYFKAENDSKRISGERKPEILWDIERIPQTDDYKIIILILHQPKKYDDGTCYNPYRYEFRMYVCSNSNVKISQVKNGRILNIFTPEWHQALNYFRKYTEERQNEMDEYFELELSEE
ncbi:hypothetical protein P4H27_07465 [Paenibacillus taichungensis]|uniref:hypothetical protein n=1 Tax=Paenibacillus taichungensis TaxID=484184 RepID=UPI002DBF35E5|nr:hypothetical protein [Paenibacillus taichungensis]MEC0106775.1 hypothetical protein [Paenibacillus taichungensis]MEC0195295.1 hypothetical protein [Paenibacillus taichungensis]